NKRKIGKNTFRVIRSQRKSNPNIKRTKPKKRGEKMRNIKLTIEYDGGRYDGWQRLGKDESSNTVEQKLLEVIRKMTNENPTLNCGSRTEVGVHAYEQVANFQTKSSMRPLEMKHYF